MYGVRCHLEVSSLNLNDITMLKQEISKEQHQKCLDNEFLNI